VFCGSSLVALFVDGGRRVTGVMRLCATSLNDQCKTVSNKDIPEIGLKDATGTFCFCTGDLCNGGSLTGSAPQAMVGRMAAISFTVISLLALAAARVLSQ